MRKRRNSDADQPAFEQGSGNVFADLALDDADEHFAHARLGFHVYTLLRAKDLKQREIAALLGVKQPEVSRLMNGDFSRFTTDKLVEFLRRLDRGVLRGSNVDHAGGPLP